MCGRNDAKSSGGHEEGDTQDTNDKTTITASSEVDCDFNNFNATGGCNITLAGKLLIVLDVAKDDMDVKNNGFYCFCELLYSNLNGTKVTAEVLTGNNKAKNCSSIEKERVNETLLKKELNSLNTKYQPRNGEAGVALIVSDSSNMSDLFEYFPNEKEEPFIYFVSVGKPKNTSINDSCHRQYRSIHNMSEMSTIGSELMENACNFYGFVENNCLSSPRNTATIPTLATVQMPIVVVSVIGVLILTIVIALCLIFTPRCRRKVKSKEEIPVEFSAVDNRVGGISELLYSEGRTFQSNLSRDSQNICSEVQTNENREKEKNCNYLHMKLREDKIDPTIYERMVLEEDSAHAVKAIATK